MHKPIGRICEKEYQQQITLKNIATAVSAVDAVQGKEVQKLKKNIEKNTIGLLLRLNA